MNINRLPHAEKIRFLKAISALNNDPNFAVLDSFLRDELSIVDKALRRDTQNVAMTQGKAQILEELITLAETSRDVLQELQKQ